MLLFLPLFGKQPFQPLPFFGVGCGFEQLKEVPDVLASDELVHDALRCRAVGSTTGLSVDGPPETDAAADGVPTLEPPGGVHKAN